MKVIRLGLLAVSPIVFLQGAGAPSQEELIKQVLLNIESKDQNALEQLTISKEESKKYVWPTLAARVSSGMPSDKYHGMYAQASAGGLTQNLSEMGGKKWQIVKVSPGAIQKQTKEYRLFSAPEVFVRDAAGQEQTVRPVGGLLEQGGSFKVMTYDVSTAGQAK